MYFSTLSAKVFTPIGALEAVLWNTIVKQNSLTPSTSTRSGLSLQVTQAFLDAVNAAIPSSMMSTSSLPAVGTTTTIPDFVYQNSTNSHFTYEVDMTQNGATLKFFWTADFAQYGFSQTATGSTFVMSNDTATNSSYLDINQTSPASRYTLYFKSDSLSSIAGAFAKVVIVSSGSTYTLKGYGDNNGGVAVLTTPTATYTEEFNAANQVNDQVITGSGAATWGSGIDATYAAKVLNTDFGSASTFF